MTATEGSVFEFHVNTRLEFLSLEIQPNEGTEELFSVLKSWELNLSERVSKWKVKFQVSQWVSWVD
jgi:hypothetical protein